MLAIRVGSKGLLVNSLLPALFPTPRSGVLTPAFWADGLVDNPAGQTIAHGDQVRFLPFSELMA